VGEKYSSEGAISKLQPKYLWVKDIQFRRRHSKRFKSRSQQTSQYIQVMCKAKKHLQKEAQFTKSTKMINGSAAQT